VLADAAYGNDSAFREGLERLGLFYAVGIQSSTSVWPPDTEPLPPKPRQKMGRPPALLRRDERHQPLSVKEVTLCLSPIDLRRVNWRERAARCTRVLLPCAYASPTATIGAASLTLSSGC
jgi:SRSO17 transposase